MGQCYEITFNYVHFMPFLAKGFPTTPIPFPFQLLPGIIPPFFPFVLSLKLPNPKQVLLPQAKSDLSSAFTSP